MAMLFPVPKKMVCDDLRTESPGTVPEKCWLQADDVVRSRDAMPRQGTSRGFLFLPWQNSPGT
jgi:hypothetical protein